MVRTLGRCHGRFGLLASPYLATQHLAKLVLLNEPTAAVTCPFYEYADEHRNERRARYTRRPPRTP